MLHPDVWFGGGPGLIAQALGEYGAAGAVITAFGDVFTTAMNRIESGDLTAWGIIVAVAFLIWFAFFRRR